VPGTLPRVLGPSWEAVADESESEAVERVSEASVAEAEPYVAETEPYVAGAEPYVAGAEPCVAEAEPYVDETQPCVAEAEPCVAVPEPEPEAEPLVPPAEPPTPFAVFVSVLARIALGRGATRAAAGLTALCEQGRVAPGALDDVSLRALMARRIVAPSGTHATAEFVASLDAWRGVLDGTGGDLSACGASTLDTWAAELVAAALGAASGEVPELRRELRRAGVAAFGLLAVA